MRQVKRHARVTTAAAPVRVLGVDDWAWRRGQRHGTVLVDLERRCVVDLLPDRSAASLAQWLQAHPEVEVVSRDRLGSYADGARKGAPAAIQVADRFHLPQNLIRAVEQQLGRMPEVLLVPMATTPPPPTPSPASSDPAAPATAASGPQRAIPANSKSGLRALFDQVLALQRQGYNNQQIMCATRVGRHRVERWTRLGRLPERRRMLPRAGMPETFRAYLAERWAQGRRNGRELLREVRERGYTGCYSGLARQLSVWCQTVPTAACPRANSDTVEPARHRLTPPVAAALLAKHPGELSATQARASR